jgi:hypothetical protein
MSFLKSKIKTKELKTDAGTFHVKVSSREVAKCPKCKQGITHHEGINNFCITGKHKMFD